MTVKRPFVSVVIPVFNNGDTLGRVLDGLAAQTWPKDRFEVIVADNNSTDDSADVAAKKGAKVVTETARQSSYAARNKGIEAAKGEILAFLDGDCVPAPGWLAAGVQAMEDAGADLAGGRIDISADGGSELLARYERLSYVRQAETVAAHGTSAGGNLFIRRKVIEKIGPFRADLASGGDGEICIRARRAGFAMAYADDAVVTHRAIGSVTALLGRYHRLGKGEAALVRHDVAPIRDAGSTLLSRKIDYIKRVWRADLVPVAQRVAIVLLNLAASVAQLLGSRASQEKGAGDAARNLTTLALLAILFVIAFTVRWQPQAEEVLYPDAAQYMRQAVGHLQGEASISPPWIRVTGGGPVYPALTALFAFSPAGVETAGLWISRLSGVAIVLLTAWLALRLFGLWAGGLAGLLAAVEPRLVHFSQVNLTESLFVALWLAVAIWALRLLAGRGRRWETVGLGALLATVGLTRAVGVAIIPAVTGLLLVLGPLVLKEPPRVWLKRAALVGGTALLVLGLYQGIAWTSGWHTALDSHAPQSLVALNNGGASAPSAIERESAGVIRAAGIVGNTLYRQALMFPRLLPGTVWALFAIGLIYRLSRWRKKPNVADPFLLGMVGLYLLALAVVGTAWPRYLLATTPFIFLYAGIGLAVLAGWGGRLTAGRIPSAPAAVAAGAVLIGAVAVIGTHGIFTVPDRTYMPVRELAERVVRTTPLAEPVMVFADHAYLPYYLNGYWRGRALPPERVANTPGGSRVVALDVSHMDTWSPAWRQGVVNGMDVGPFRLIAQQFTPDYRGLLSVYADASPRPTVSGTGAALLAAGRLKAARKAFAVTGNTARGPGTVETVLGQYFPERLLYAHNYLQQAGALNPDAKVVSTRVWWARPPGEIYLTLDDVAVRWNRAAVALATGDAKSAWRDVQALSRTFLEDPRYAYLRGLTLMRLGHVQEAEATLRVARAGLPGDPGVTMAWANVQATLGKYDEAETLYMDILAADPDNAGGWLNLIQTRLMTGDLAAARRAVERASRLKMDPKNARRFDLLTLQVKMKSRLQDASSNTPG